MSVPPEQIRLIFGHQDSNLRAITKAIPAKVVVLGDEIEITADEVRDATRMYDILQSLRGLASQRSPITERHVQDLIQQATAPDFAEADAAGELGSKPPKSITAGKISPKTRGQARYMQAMAEKDLVFCSGPAGSGKTYLAVAMAIEALRLETVRKLVLVRPAVEAGEKLGFLPGDMLAKVNPFLRPLLDALREMLDFETVQRYMDHDVIEIVPLAFMRGRTLNDTFMILDEAQNSTVTQMKMFLTRMGNGSKIVVTGDVTQNDLPSHVPTGLSDAMRRLGHIPGVASIQLDGRDIVRHRLVREIVKAYDVPKKSEDSKSSRND